MSKSSMRDRIKTNILLRNTNLDAANIAILDPYLEDICDGIIEEIKANIEISILVTAVQPGVGTAPGTSQAVL